MTRTEAETIILEHAEAMKETMQEYDADWSGYLTVTLIDDYIMFNNHHFDETDKKVINGFVAPEEENTDD